MGFLDEAVIVVRSGDGGSGCISFRREKFVPKGGPDGGDGGTGGSIIIRATKRHLSLSHYQSRTHFRASGGEPGKGKNQHGKNAPDLILEVPLGTLVEDLETRELLADLVRDQQDFLVIPGGMGGKGNRHFATSTNRAPRRAHPGTPGQEKRLRLSLKFIADIGLVGLPNTGKSTLLSRLSMAHPKIDNYPFTTLVPNLGIMTLQDHRDLTIADIPGLVEGASEGRGLGHRFLKHIERTQVLLHLLDITYSPRKNILEDYHTLRNEILAYNPMLSRKTQVVLINKMDLYGPQHRDIGHLQGALEHLGLKSLPISALTGQGLDQLKKILFRMTCAGPENGETWRTHSPEEIC
jgi:GTP-binding protein